MGSDFAPFEGIPGFAGRNSSDVKGRWIQVFKEALFFLIMLVVR